MGARRVFTSKVNKRSQKIVIVGIDFGTSYTKVYFNQDGEIKLPLRFNVDGQDSYFLPTQLFYSPQYNKIYFTKQAGTECLKFFKYSMINDGLLTSQTLRQNNKFNDSLKPEFLCSIYYLANLIKNIKGQISGLLKTKDIKYTFNMGCPIENWDDKDRGKYDEVLSLGYVLSDTVEDGIDFSSLYEFYQSNKNKNFENLQTVPELYAEALWFIEQPSTGEGLYTILDVGGGTVDFASIYVFRTAEGEKKTKIYSQNVMPLGIEILLQYMFPIDYESKRSDRLYQLKTKSVIMPFGWEKKYEENRNLLKAHEFDVKFASGIAEVKERNRTLMDEQNLKRKQIPYYTFGGGADFNWYHSIIDSHKYAFSNANIPPLTRQDVILNAIPDNRLIIAEQLTRSNFPDIDGFPWHFSRQCLFSSLERD